MNNHILLCQNSLEFLWRDVFLDEAVDFGLRDEHAATQADDGEFLRTAPAGAGAAGAAVTITATQAGVSGSTTDGTLSPVTGSSFPNGPDVVVNRRTPGRLTADPSGKFLYVANSGATPSVNTADITAFAIDPSDGALTLIGTFGTGLTDSSDGQSP